MNENEKETSLKPHNSLTITETDISGLNRKIEVDRQLNIMIDIINRIVQEQLTGGVNCPLSSMGKNFMQMVKRGSEEASMRNGFLALFHWQVKVVIIT